MIKVYRRQLKSEHFQIKKGLLYFILMCFELLSNLPPFASKQLFETCSGLEYRHSKIEMSLFFTNKHVEDIILETEVCLGQGTLLAFFFSLLILTESFILVYTFSQSLVVPSCYFSLFFPSFPSFWNQCFGYMPDVYLFCHWLFCRTCLYQNLNTGTDPRLWKGCEYHHLEKSLW